MHSMIHSSRVVRLLVAGVAASSLIGGAAAFAAQDAEARACEMRGAPDFLACNDGEDAPFLP
jgi:hypothetical protein